ncbi:MAG TPA: hypothetical protein VEB86_09000 [Chryseosolibacter sp.]|nr:hypothetical protein [Chryseosolibacter sp.]
MLQDKYLPTFDFFEHHSIQVASPPERIFPLIDELDLGQSRLIRFLFLLRGMGADMTLKHGLLQENFVELEKISDQELALGLVGQFWRPSGNLQKLSPAEFLAFNTEDFAKAVWNFRLTRAGHQATMVETETRILCLGGRARRRFSFYWFFIKPFSGIIRMEILRLIKRTAERR